MPPINQWAGELLARSKAMASLPCDSFIAVAPALTLDLSPKGREPQQPFRQLPHGAIAPGPL